MTATHDEPTSDGIPVFIWFGVPQIGQEHVLMVVANDPTHGLTFRPLVYIEPERHIRYQSIAEKAAESLGVTAVLREYRCVSILDRIVPAP